MTSSDIEVPGLYIQNDIISEKLEEKIIDYLNSYEWNTELSRRTIHQGFKYPYSGGTSTSLRTRDIRYANGQGTLIKIDPIVGYLKHLADYLGENKVMGTNDQDQPIIPNQVIVNEYTRDQGISCLLYTSDAA